MLARLEPVLHASTFATLTATGFAGASPLDDPIRNGVLVNLQDPPWNGTADFFFDAPDFTDNPNSTQRSEYRATYSGESRFNITIQATAPQIATIQLQEMFNASNGYDLITLTTAKIATKQEIGY
jgi:hypothetical protein